MNGKSSWQVVTAHSDTLQTARTQMSLTPDIYDVTGNIHEGKIAAEAPEALSCA
jgi:hypothetical protein